MIEPISLIPLGIIHSDAYDYCRKPLMELIEAEWQAGRPTLWGYDRGENWNASKPIPYPHTSNSSVIRLLDRAERTAFPGLAYYGDVSAFHRNRSNVYSWT